MDKQLQDRMSDILIAIASLSHTFKLLEEGKEIDFSRVNNNMLTVFTDMAELLEEITEAL